MHAQLILFIDLVSGKIRGNFPDDMKGDINNLRKRIKNIRRLKVKYIYEIQGKNR